jgi:hypothetical protein
VTELGGDGLISVEISVLRRHSGILFGLYYYASVLPKPKIGLVGAMDLSHTAGNRDERFTRLIELPNNSFALVRHVNVQKAGVQLLNTGCKAFALTGKE